MLFQKNICRFLPRCGLVRRGLSILIVLAFFGIVCVSQEQPQEPQLFLTQQLGFSRDQILQVEGGAVVVKILKREKHEVAAVAAARLNVPQKFFIDRFRDIERHKKAEAVLQVKKLGDPVQAEDFADLMLLPREIRDLQACQPGDCPFKLSRPQIELLQQQVDFSAPEAEEQANAFMRNLLADYAREYAAGGNKAMIVYDDKSHAVESAAQFTALLDGSPYLLEYAPEFDEYLRDFPDQTLQGVERFQYWSRENYGHDLKPVVAITDAIIYLRPAGAVPAALIASKQIYASHYYEASLGLTMLFERTQADFSPSFYLVYVNRSRIDLLRKWYSGLARGRLSDSVRSSMNKSLVELRSKVEAEYTAAEASRRRVRRPSAR